MDVAREFKAVDYKIKLQIRRQALEATAKIYGMTPEAYANQLLEEQRQAAADAAYNTGLAIGQMYKSLQDAAASMAAGIRAAMGR